MVEDKPGTSVRVSGSGVSPRLGFTVDALFSVRQAGEGSVVEVEADVAASGGFAGLGQRSLEEQAHRLLVAYLSGYGRLPRRSGRSESRRPVD